MHTNALILVGSARLHSHTDALGIAIEAALSSRGASVTRSELAAMDLPHADPAFHRDPRQHTDPKVRSLVDQADQADVFVFLSPVYHNSFSGLLKTTLDHLSIGQFSGKVVGLGSHGGNRTTQAVDQLRIVTRGLNALAITTQVCTQDSDFSPNEASFSLTEGSILERVERFADELLRVSKALRA